VAHPLLMKPSYSSLRAQPEGGRQEQGTERFPPHTQPELKGISSAGFDFFIWEPFKLSVSLYDSKLLLFCKRTCANHRSLLVCGRSSDADREGGGSFPQPKGNISHFSREKQLRGRQGKAVPTPLHPGWPCCRSPESFGSADAGKARG